jgi:CTP synthase (UTP-ammonia lyase)
MKKARIALIGDFNADVPAHRAIPLALELAGNVTWEWIGTDTITNAPYQLEGFDGVWCVPASPYRSFDGALSAIRFARETNRAFLGTCGGFQHAIIEFARHVMGMTDADHAESNPQAELQVIKPLACALMEQSNTIRLEAGSRIAEICGALQIEGAYRCSYGLDPAFEAKLQDTALQITGRDDSLEARVVELRSHHFFICTLFQPERAALTGQAHPLVNAFVMAARDA